MKPKHIYKGPKTLRLIRRSSISPFPYVDHNNMVQCQKALLRGPRCLNIDHFVISMIFFSLAHKLIELAVCYKPRIIMALLIMNNHSVQHSMMKEKCTCVTVHFILSFRHSIGANQSLQQHLHRGKLRIYDTKKQSDQYRPGRSVALLQFYLFLFLKSGTVTRSDVPCFFADPFRVVVVARSGVFSVAFKLELPDHSLIQFHPVHHNSCGLWVSGSGISRQLQLFRLTFARELDGSRTGARRCRLAHPSRLICCLHSLLRALQQIYLFIYFLMRKQSPSASETGGRPLPNQKRVGSLVCTK